MNKTSCRVAWRKMNARFNFMAVEPAGRIESQGSGIVDFAGPAEAAKSPARRQASADDATARFIQSILFRPERWGINE